MKIISFILFFQFTASAWAGNQEQCAHYENMVKDLQTVEMEITSDQGCMIDGENKIFRTRRQIEWEIKCENERIKKLYSNEDYK
jgi:hypothetical protein